MRRISFLSFCLLLSSVSVFAQNSKIRISALLLTHEKAGWRVDFPDGTAGEYSLQSGDLLTEFDGSNAGRMGPLAVTRAFNDAFSRAVQLTIQRGSRLQKINLWRSDEPAPSTKPDLEKSFVTTEEEAPDFTLPTLKNALVRLSSQRGRWVLISFWATWCAPCQEEAEILNKLAQAYPQQLKVLALAVKDTRENLTAFSAKIKPAYTILDAGPLDAQPALTYGVGIPSGGGSVPVNVLVRPDGRIAYVQGGYVASSPLEKQVRDALAGNKESLEDQSAAKPPLSMPFDFFSNQILLKVGVNASEPVWFVLDSGASGCVIDAALAQKLGIKIEGEKQGSGAGKGTVKFTFARHVTYELPGLSLPVDESYVIDLSGQPALLGRYVGGILGYSFFAPYVVDVDFDARIVTLYDPENYHPVGHAVPFTMTKHTPHILVKLGVGGHPPIEREVLVDSGSQDAIDDDLLAESPDRLEVIGGVGLGQEFRTTLGRADSLLLDSFSLPHPLGAAGGAGLIGNEVLRRFHVGFDYSHARIFLSPGLHFSDPFVFDASGLDLRWAPTSSDFVIHDVAKASAASDAGLRVGDTFSAINGQPASSFTLEQLSALLSEDGRELWLTVKRGADSRSVHLILRKRL